MTPSLPPRASARSAVVLSLFSYLLAVVYGELYEAAFKARATRVVSDIFRAQLETAMIGALLDEFAFVLALLALVGLAASVRLVHGSTESAPGSLLRAAFYVVALLLAILDVAAFALNERHFSITYSGRDLLKDDLDVPGAAWQALRATNVVALVMLVVQLVAALLVLLRSLLVAVRTRSDPRVETARVRPPPPPRCLGLPPSPGELTRLHPQATHYLLACCALLLLRSSYAVGFYAKYVPFGDAQSVMADADAPRPGSHLAILDVVLGTWPMLVLFVLLFVLAAKKQHGLWSTDQPFMTVRPAGEGAPLQTPWGYDYSPQSQQPLHPTWHQPETPPPHAAPAAPPHGSPRPQWQAAPFPPQRPTPPHLVPPSSPPPPAPRPFRRHGALPPGRRDAAPDDPLALQRKEVKVAARQLGARRPVRIISTATDEAGHRLGVGMPAPARADEIPCNEYPHDQSINVLLPVGKRAVAPFTIGGNHGPALLGRGCSGCAASLPRSLLPPRTQRAE